jgi:hypothetical protein
MEVECNRTPTNRTVCTWSLLRWGLDGRLVFTSQSSAVVAAVALLRVHSVTVLQSGKVALRTV